MRESLAYTAPFHRAAFFADSARPAPFQSCSNVRARLSKFMSGWSEGRLLSRRDWAPGISTLRVEAEIESFSPGQFVNLSVAGAPDDDRRSYSIASPPGAPLEFLVTEVEGGKLTPRLLALAPGDPLLVE